MLRAMHNTQPLRLLAAGAFFCTLLPLSGCTVVAVGAAAVSVTATAVGVAADVAVGTVKLAGKGVGAAYGALSDDKPDNSGLSIKYRESDPNHPYRPATATTTEAAAPSVPPSPTTTAAPRLDSPSFSP